MGVWGTGLFSDDMAADVRLAYREGLTDGLSGEAATNKVLEAFADSVDDPDDGPPFWLGLAATQSQCGRLEARVRDRALRIIDEGLDIRRFSEQPNLVKARGKVLEKLRAQLSAPQKEPVKVRKLVPFECDWKPGELIGYRLDSGELAVLHVQAVVEGRDTYPYVSVLNIDFADVSAVTSSTQVRRSKGARFGPYPDSFAIAGMKKRDLSSDRLLRTGKALPVIASITGTEPGSFIVAWKGLSNFIETFLERPASAHHEAYEN
jgi:hypothetical protein